MNPGDSVPIQTQNRPNPLAVWACIAATAIALHTCLQIEWWNARAGGVLPRGSHGDRNPKWRIEAGSSLIARGDPEPDQEQLLRDSERQDAEAQLRDWVGTAGLAQYGIAPFAFLLSLILLARAGSARGRLGFAALAILSGNAVVMMLYREYFTSLGW